MTSATIISSVRTPAGKLKGYNLFLDGEEKYMTASQIKAHMLQGELQIDGMKINSAGALISVSGTEDRNSDPAGTVQMQNAGSLPETNTAAAPEHTSIPVSAENISAAPVTSINAQVHIYEALDPFQKNYMAARQAHSGKAVAFVKRRIT